MFKDFLGKHSNLVLTIGGLALFGAALYLVNRADKKSFSEIDAEVKRRSEEADGTLSEALTKKEIVKMEWKNYIPAAVCVGLGTAAFVSNNKIYEGKLAAVLATYSVAKNEIKEFTEKTTELVGEDKVKEIKSSIIDDHIKKNPPKEKIAEAAPKEEDGEVVRPNEMGDYPFYDAPNDRYFLSTDAKVNTAVNQLCKAQQVEMTITENQLYSLLGLNPTKHGDTEGWDVNKNGWVEVQFGTHVDDTGRTYRSIDYDTELLTDRW